MKKNMFLIFIFGFLFLPFTVLAVADISGGGGGDAENINDPQNGEIANTHDLGMRVTIYDEDGNRISNSVDVVFSRNVYNRLVNHGEAYNTLGKQKSKVDYIKTNKPPLWDYSSLEDKIIFVSDNTGQADASSTSIPDNLLKGNAESWYEQMRNNPNATAPSKVINELKTCKNYQCTYGKKYYAVLEPTFYIWYNSKRYYGSAYELAYLTMSEHGINNGATKLDNWVNNHIPRTLVLSGKVANMTFYRNINIEKFCDNWETCFGDSDSKMKRSVILNDGVGISVYDWTDILKTQVDITCNINVNINECGESVIDEAVYNGTANKKECIVDNSAYEYIKGCNLYCADEITTDFSGFYGTFIGNNKVGAIKSGKYIAIKSNPKITIKKTCYQSNTSNECSDISGSFKNQLNSDYNKANKIYLTVDGKKYEFIGNANIISNGYSSANITYEYKLNESINKYIDIETMQGITNPINKSYYTNDGPTIITSKATYGDYEYNLDVSETPLNKYISSSKYIKNVKNSQSAKYNFVNKITINYKKTNGNKKNNYTSDDLKNTTCEYKKYNTDEGCIGEENKCVDSVTCEVLDSCEVCECKSEYGCYDDSNCTPITEPKSSDEDACDPEKKTCFPNIIYRPISLIEPFPGIDGDNRIPGNNWNKIIKLTNGKTYSYGDYYIRNRRGYANYEIYQAEPLYVIKLDGAKIQAIRKYNDKHDYNDFELTCVNGENCVSNFLRGTATDFSINLINSGTCQNINTNTFDSCIKNKGE